MAEIRPVDCPECAAVDRREFVRLLTVGAAAATTGVTSVLPGFARAADLPMPKERKPRLAEDLIKELYTGMKDEQKKQVCRPFTDPARLSVNPNRALDRMIGSVYTKPQIELIERIIRAISGSDEGFWQISRAGTWDASRTFVNMGANFFGDPTSGKFAFLFTGHHLTIRCDGDSDEGSAFGGPIYYGHTPNPYSDKNVFYYQTKQAMKFFDALNKDQTKNAVITKGNPGEGAGSIKFRGKDAPKPGIGYKDLTADQKELMEQVMHSILYPFRKEDADEVMSVIKTTGGMDKMHFAFYGEGYEGAQTEKKQPWSFWRIEGPGFVWNFRVLPHVHTYVNISSKIG